MGTFNIISASIVKGYKTSGDGFVANGTFVVVDDVLNELNGTVYDEDFMETYLGGFKGKYDGEKMQYKINGNIEKVTSATGIIERYINDMYNK